MGGGGVSEIFYLRIKELFFFPCPCLTPIVSDIQTISTSKKCKKWRKTCGESDLPRRASPAMAHHLAWVLLCTHKRDFATVTLIPGRCFDRGGRGGGGIGFYNNLGEEPSFSIFPESLGPKGSDWCSFQVDGSPSGDFRAAQS